MPQFCPDCGAALRRVDATFCSTCGKALQAHAPTPTPGAQVALHIQEAGQPDKTLFLSQPVIRIGREPTNEIVLASDRVSRHHAKLAKNGVVYTITDEGSANGVWLNGLRLPPYQAQPLTVGNFIYLGDQSGAAVTLTVQAVGGAAQPGGIAPSPQKTGTIRLPDRPDLLNLASFTIGRDPAQNQLPLDHPNISRRHARFVRTAQGHTIEDLGSSNGTFINGQYLQGVRALQRGDVIQIGPYKLVYDQGQLSQPILATGYRIDANTLARTVRVGFWQRKNLQILKPVNLAIQPGEFVALVGGSGAGKSTLMKALSGFFPADQGQVLLNGDNLYANFAAYRSLLGYVPQDDIIHGQLPVRNALTYAARLRLPDATHSEIVTRVDKVLAQVEMQDHAAKIVNRLSGGQRKRVSIAVELLAEPKVFFLDEPTSGLDPGLEKKMMQTMRTLADDGRTVVLVTHATANINLCHQVAFLAEGHLAYYGPPQDAAPFFRQRDFSDIYNTLSAPGAGAQWAQNFAQRHPAQAIRASSPTPPSLGKPRSPRVSPWQQFLVLVQRMVELIRRDWLSLLVLLLVMPIIGTLLLLMVNAQDLVGKPLDEVSAEIQQEIADKKVEQDPAVNDEQFQGAYTVAGAAQKVLLMLALAANLLGVFAAAYEIVKEEAIYQRERMVNLKIWPYLLSKIVVLGFFGAVQCALLLVVIGFGLEYPADGVLLAPRLELFITLFLATLASTCLGLLISAAVNSRNTVIYLILLVLFVQILFAGALFKLEGASAISYLTTTRWTLEALGSTVNMNSLNEQGVSCLAFETPLPGAGAAAGSNEPCTDSQTKLPADFEFHIDYTATSAHLLQRWALLLAFAIGFSLLTYWVQRRKDAV